MLASQRYCDYDADHNMIMYAHHMILAILHEFIFPSKYPLYSLNRPVTPFHYVY